jgi:hypothetical protein
MRITSDQSRAIELARTTSAWWWPGMEECARAGPT